MSGRRQVFGVVVAAVALCGCASREELMEARERTSADLVRIEKRLEALETGIEELGAGRAEEAAAAGRQWTLLSQRADVLDSRMNGLARNMDALKASQVAARTAPPSPGRQASAKTARPGGVAGSWVADFHFEKNTAHPGEAPHPWISFQMDLEQDGQGVRGTLKGVSYSVTGTVKGKATSEGFEGTMRLSWDAHDWEVLRFQLGEDEQRAQGEAIFGASDTEKHHYRLGMRRQ